MIAEARLPHRVVLAADGGIREHTVPLLREAGAETVVLGSLAFGAPNLEGPHGVASQPVSGGVAIAIDLGGTQIRAALVDRAGHILQRAAESTRATAGPEVVLGQIAGLAKAVSAGRDLRRHCGVGVSSPGPLDTAEGVALGIPTISGFENFPSGCARRKAGAAAGAGKRRHRGGDRRVDIRRRQGLCQCRLCNGEHRHRRRSDRRRPGVARAARHGGPYWAYVIRARRGTLCLRQSWLLRSLWLGHRLHTPRHCRWCCETQRCGF